ncbi:IclR family transcriptional regulator [Sinisalibacter aestuarii]|uniref:IclR family transcriptional regulator n=1 Tax=Sinisalibacter aestuarii TaxID=2949426 RepID=A0ABQ5LQ21_9RHOB|nr:helix-turn-helix domain-containing protein [Sinisalibacter aestuarii]GKY87076.1 IclR family transcriptional regulator [Sinisalibacter aestuarii]
MSQRARGIQSVQVSGRILRALTKANKPMMLKELAIAADLVPAQCHAYLTSLKNVGLVHQDHMTGHYRTGPFALRLGIGWIKSSPLASAALAELKALTDELGVISLIAVWGNLGPTIVSVNASVSLPSLNIRQGTVYSVTGTATGHVFAACGSFPTMEEQIAKGLDRSSRSRGIGSFVTREDLDEVLKITRARGYATAVDRPIPGISAAAAPIFDAHGKLVFVAALIGRSDETSVAEDSIAVTRLLSVTRKLSAGQHKATEPAEGADINTVEHS